MTAAVHLIPIGISALCWVGLFLVNRRTRWFRVGEIIFWDAILLIIIFLAWLKWF